jgi:hypothetical protein
VRKLAIVCVFVVSLSLSLFAGPIAGTFTIDGSVLVTAAGITWVSNTAVADQATISSLGLSGSFVGMDNDTVGINNLTDLPGDQPVGTSFTDFDFIDFPAMVAYPSLLANFISLGSGNPANCSTDSTTASAGQTCTLTSSTTPAEPGGSPFTFLNTLNGANGCCNSSATWDISGVTADGLSTWSAIFTSEFTTPYQTVLNNFAITGQVQDSFSGALTVSIAPITSVPEPAALTLTGTGLIALSFGLRRRKRKS